MSEEKIDYQAIAETLQRELEQARITILKLRYSHTIFPLDIESIRDFIIENSTVIIVAMMLLSFILGSLKTIKSLFSHKP